jgi:DNA-3-methyladenine glycosylase II
MKGAARRIASPRTRSGTRFKPRSVVNSAPVDERDGPLVHLKKRDPILARLIESVGPFALRVSPIHSPFGALAEAIIHQQITGKAAATITLRFKEAVGRAGAFPTPEDVEAAPDKVLRSAGLSGPKARAIRDLAAKALDGTLPSLEALETMEESLIVERLTRIRGVGPWTVHMLLIFRLGRRDVLPATDYGVRKGFQRTFGSRDLPSPKEIERRAERWRPYRSIASWYLWRALELPRHREDPKERSAKTQRR